MSMITIQKSELVELEDLLKEKTKQIKQLQLDVEILTGLNYHNGALLVKSTLDNAKTLRDVYILFPIIPTDTKHLKQRDEKVAELDIGIAAQQEKLDRVRSNTRAFCTGHAGVVRILLDRFAIDLPAMAGGVNDG